jgi:hypothetical protein
MIESNKKIKISVLLFSLLVSICAVFPMLERVHYIGITGGDQSQYAKATIDLYRSWQDGSIVWWLTMVGSMKSKPPILPWIGQFVVPLRGLLGSTDSALTWYRGHPTLLRTENNEKPKLK